MPLSSGTASWPLPGWVDTWETVSPSFRAFHRGFDCVFVLRMRSLLLSPPVDYRLDEHRSVSVFT